MALALSTRRRLGLCPSKRKPPKNPKKKKQEESNLNLFIKTSPPTSSVGDKLENEEMRKQVIDFNKDIGLNCDGEPMNLIFIDFEPVPLLPTYSFVFNGQEIRYSLNRNPYSNKPVDRLNRFYLEKIK